MPPATPPLSNSAKERYLSARREWWRLYRRPDCWRDPAARLSMLAARLRYQDALLDWHFVWHN